MSVETGSWVWCRVCERCYRWGWDRGPTSEGDEEGCPYWECTNEAGDVLAWKRIRRLHPEFPSAPELGRVYHVDGWLWCDRCARCFKFDVDGERCPYKGCPPGQKHAWPWWRIRVEHEGYPEEPERGRRYSRVVRERAGEVVAYRRERTGDSSFKSRRDKAHRGEVVCPGCLTINKESRNRCMYCSEVLPGVEGWGRDLRLGQSWGHADGAFVVFRG
jgi:hypothetical protein